MAKRSKRRPARQNKDHAGCMWGLMSIFDFRHGRTTRRLLSDRRYPAKNTAGSAYPTSEANLHTSSKETHLSVKVADKSEKPAFDLIQTRVKELIEEEMCLEQAPKKNQTETNNIESLGSETCNRVTNHKQTEKTSKRSFDHEISISRQVSAPKTSPYHDLEVLMQEILLVHHKRNGDLDTGVKRPFPVVEEKFIAAVEGLMNEKSTNGNDAFQTLSSNKELLMKLLQDQDRNLGLVNEDQKSKLKSKTSSVLSENELTEREPDEPTSRKHRKFFRRRSRSHESIPMNGKDKIVILKSGSPDNQIVDTEKNASHFSFMEIKRRLKHAMGKEQPGLGPGPGPGPSPVEKTGKTVVDSGWSSPNRDHFYTERFARVSKFREAESKTGDTNHQISKIYTEAKKHLSEMLTSGDEDAESMIRSLPKSLGRLLSIREYNSLSPGTSPKAQTRSVSCEDPRMVNKSQPSTSVDHPEEKVVVSDDTSSEGVREIVKSPTHDKEEDIEVLDRSCEPSNLSSHVDDYRDKVISDGGLSPESLKPDLPEENELSSSRTTSPTGSSVASKTIELEIATSDRIEKPSPVSVLEPLLSDDDISPARTVPRPAEPPVQPLCIRFDEPDQQIQIRNPTDAEESAFEYVEAVLLSSDLNWIEFEKRWLASAPILDPSLFDEVEIFSSRARCDQHLLFDSTNEALKEVCDRYVLESPFIKRALWPVPKGMGLINEIWGRVESRLGNAYPRDLDKLVKYDVEVSKTWFDVSSEARDIVFKIEESIFEETIGDTLLSLSNYCS